MNNIRLIHFADIHLGYTGPTNLVIDESESPTLAGRYVREVDIENAVKSMTKHIVNMQPLVDVVVIAGDFFHKPVPYPRAISAAAKMVRTLVKHDISVVIIDGNHETTGVLNTGSPTTFLKELGAHVINGSSCEIMRDCWNCIAAERKERMSRLAIHALPYRALRGNPGLIDVRPLPGYINVLLSHGRVSGMDELNSLHHTAYTIPSQVLQRGWDYIALGDWHVHRHEPLKDVPAFYAGSLEALNFGEAMKYPASPHDMYTTHGILDVHLRADAPTEVRTITNDAARPLLRLEAIDAMQADVTTLMEMVYARLHNKLPVHAIVLLEVNNVLPHVYEKLDHAGIAERRKLVRSCNIRWSFQRNESTQSGEAMSEAALDRQWEHFLEQREQNVDEYSWQRDEGLQRIEEARQHLLAAYAQEGE